MPTVTAGAGPVGRLVETGAQWGSEGMGDTEKVRKRAVDSGVEPAEAKRDFC